MDADRKRLLAERRHLLSRLTSVELVEDTVKELYVQMKVNMNHPCFSVFVKKNKQQQQQQQEERRWGRMYAD